MAKYLEAHRGRLLTDRPTLRNAALQISKELGLQCTEHNLRSIMRASGVVWRSFTPNPDHVVRSNNTRVLARAICEMADALGHKIDPSVYLIAAGRNPDHPGQGI